MKQISGKPLSYIFFATALLALAACGPKPSQENAANPGNANENASQMAIPVEYGTAKKEPIVANYTGTAALEPEREAQVAAKTSGVLVKLLVEEGDIVKAGQGLAQLDSERARLELARVGADLKRLESDYKRSEELSAAKLISQESHEKVKYQLDTQRAAYQLARLELSYTYITASIDGVVSQRLVKEGNLIQLNQTLFRIDDFDPLLAVLSVPERELMTLKAGLPAQMSVDALPGKTFAGKVSRVSPVIDAKTGTFRVTCEFTDESRQLTSGMFGRVSIVYDQRQDALVIPREGLIEEDGVSSVFLISREPVPQKAAAPAEDKDAKKEKEPVAPAKPQAPIFQAKQVAVTAGYMDGNRVEIRQGLQEGDRVITVGRAAVRDGSTVQLLESGK